jgi:hypothetical protein
MDTAITPLPGKVRTSRIGHFVAGALIGAWLALLSPIFQNSDFFVVAVLSLVLGLAMAIFGPRAISALQDRTRTKLARVMIVGSLLFLGLGLAGFASLWLFRDWFEYAESVSLRPWPTVPYRSLVLDCSIWSVIGAMAWSAMRACLSQEKRVARVILIAGVTILALAAALYLFAIWLIAAGMSGRP